MAMPRFNCGKRYSAPGHGRFQFRMGWFLPDMMLFFWGGGVGICLEIRARFQTARRVLLVPNAKWFDKYPYYTVHSARYYGTVRMNAV
jgi:hypothetical protein